MGKGGLVGGNVGEAWKGPWWLSWPALFFKNFLCSFPIEIIHNSRIKGAFMHWKNWCTNIPFIIWGVHTFGVGCMSLLSVLLFRRIAMLRVMQTISTALSVRSSLIVNGWNKIGAILLLHEELSLLKLFYFSNSPHLCSVKVSPEICMPLFCLRRAHWLFFLPWNAACFFGACVFVQGMTASSLSRTVTWFWAATCVETRTS